MQFSETTRDKEAMFTIEVVHVHVCS